MNIRKAAENDLARIAEIYVFNNRLYYYPIFRDAAFSFGKLQVASYAKEYRQEPGALEHTYVYDDGLLKGFVKVEGTEVHKLFVEPAFQSEGIGAALLEFAVRTFGIDHLWVLEKNTRALAFYARHGFVPTGRLEPEEGTAEWQMELQRCRNTQT